MRRRSMISVCERMRVLGCRSFSFFTHSLCASVCRCVSLCLLVYLSLYEYASPCLFACAHASVCAYLCTYANDRRIVISLALKRKAAAKLFIYICAKRLCVFIATVIVRTSDAELKIARNKTKSLRKSEWKRKRETTSNYAFPNHREIREIINVKIR